MKGLALSIALFAAACASTQAVQLLPRGDARGAAGTVDKTTRELRITSADGTEYRGEMVYKSIFGRESNDATALLMSRAGQMRCEMSWSEYLTTATGVCTDSKGATFDLLIK